MAVYDFRTRPLARDIYLYGNRKFSDIDAEYEIPVKQYAASTFTKEQIDNALAKGYISQQEYEDTTA